MVIASFRVCVYYEREAWWSLLSVKRLSDCVQDAFVKIVRGEGITALWSGLPPTLWVESLLSYYFLVIEHVTDTLVKEATKETTPQLVGAYFPKTNLSS